MKKFTTEYTEYTEARGARKHFIVFSLCSLGALWYKIFTEWLMKSIVMSVAATMIFANSLYANLRSSQLSVYAGAFDFLRTRHRTFEMGMEYQFSPNWKSPFDFLEFRPLLGVMANAKKSAYLYGGINFDLFLIHHFVISPGFAAGWYGQGDGKNLGFPIEFRTGAEVSWQFDDEGRLGLHFYHLSNAGLGKKNHGSESIVFLYDIPIKNGFPFSKTN